MSNEPGKKQYLVIGLLLFAIVAGLRSSRLVIVELTTQAEIKQVHELFENQYGRLRTAVLGRDQNLYLLTDNGGNQDQIIRVRPR